jgi:hypothetical protein
MLRQEFAVAAGSGQIRSAVSGRDLATGNRPGISNRKGDHMISFSKSISAAGLACSIALAAPSSASAAGISSLGGFKAAAPQTQVIEVRRRGVGIGLGILGIAAATAIIAGSARADRRYDYYDDRGDRCGYLDYKCSQGHGWACRKYDYRCID